MLLTVLLFILNLANSSSARTVARDGKGNYKMNSESYDFSLRIQTGYINGTANEILYSGSFTDRILENHEWEIDELYMAGFGGTVQKKWVCIHADFWTKMTEGEGTMENYGWYYNTPLWSDRTYHANTEITEAFILDVNLEFLIPQISRDKLIFSGFLGYKREHFDWSAKGGSYILSTNGGLGWRSDTGNYPDGSEIFRYRQRWDVPYIGLGVRGNIGGLEISGRVIGSLYATLNAKTLDHRSGLHTDAAIKHGKMFSVDLTGGYHITDNWLLEASASFSKYNKVRGNSTWTYADGSSVSYLDPQGGDLVNSMVALTLSYSF